MTPAAELDALGVPYGPDWVLDSFCGDGGAGEGYHRAGWNVLGIDNDPARLARYPHRTHLVDDAVPFIHRYGHLYGLNHASPPCTGYSQGTSMLPDRITRYDRLIPATREALLTTGRPYVIENVTSKVTRAELRTPIMLCWTHFNTPGSVTDTDGTPLWMRRHRLFETSFPVMAPGPCRHPKDMQCAGAYGGARRDKWEARHVRRGGYVPASVDVLRDLLGTPWMSEVGCRLAIPPAYTEFLGDQVSTVLAG